MGVSQFSSGLTVFNQQQLDEIQSRVRGVDNHRNATKYVKSRVHASLPGYATTTTILDITGQGYVRAAAAMQLTSMSPSVGDVLITIDGTTYTFNYSNAQQIVGLFPLTYTLLVPNYSLQPKYQDLGSPVTNTSHPLFDDLYFSTGFKMVIRNGSNGNCDFEVIYHVGVIT